MRGKPRRTADTLAAFNSARAATRIAQMDAPEGFLVRRLVNIVTQVLIGIVLYHMLWLSLYHDYVTPDSWHYVLCTLAYIFFMAEGILTFSVNNLWSNTLTRNTQKRVHWIFQGCGAICCIAGISVKIYAHNHNNTAHFQSYHSIAGLTSLILVLLSILVGLFVLSGHHFLPGVRLIVIKFTHNVVGVLAYAFGIVAYMLCFNTDYFQRNSTSEVAMFFIGITALLGVLILFKAINKAYYHYSQIAA